MPEKILLKVDTDLTFMKIVSIPDADYFFETAVGCSPSYFGFVTPSSFEAVHCFIFSRRRVAVARYWLICLIFLVIIQ